MEDRRGRRKDVRPQLRVDAIGADDDIGLGDRAVGEPDTCHVAVLVERRQRGDRCGRCRREGGRRGNRRDRRDACRSTLASRRHRHLHRRDRRPVVAEVERAGADARAPLLDRRTEAHALELTHRVRRDEDTGADLAECGRLLVDGTSQSLRDQRIGGEQAADAAADDDHCRSRCHDRRLPITLCAILIARVLPGKVERMRRFRPVGQVAAGRARTVGGASIAAWSVAQANRDGGRTVTRGEPWRTGDAGRLAEPTDKCLLLQASSALSRPKALSRMPGAVRKATLTRFQALMLVTRKASVDSSASLNCSRTSA